MIEKTTLLYVDDEPINLMLLEASLKGQYKVITAKSASDGLNKLKLHPEIKVVVSDMKMPEMDGIQFIEHARKTYDTLAYFILTGYDITDEIANAIDNKLISKYFHKPLRIGDLEDAIKVVLATNK